MNKKIVKVAIGVPTKGITESTAYDNHLELFGHLGKLSAYSESGTHTDSYVYPKGVVFDFKLIIIPRIFPALAREKIAEYMMAEGCDYLLMFDDDMILPADTFERLYAHNVAVVAPLAFTRLAPFRPVIYNLTKGYDPVEKLDYYINLEVPNYPKDQLVQVDAVGFGAVLIKRQVLEKLKKPWFMTTSGAGEDIHFCHRAGEAGFNIYVDTATKLGHLGDRYLITEAVYEGQDELKAKAIYGEEKKYQ